MENQVNTQAATIPIRKPGSSPTVTTVQNVPQYPTEVIDLPSKGWFYEESNPLSSGKIELRMMTARDEDILTNQNYVRKGIMFEKLLQSLIIDPNVDVKDLLLMDQNALMIAARRLAYSDSYVVNVMCPKCNDDNKIDIDLSKIKDKEVDVSQFPQGVNRFEFKLPKGGQTIIYKILSQRDQDLIDEETRQIQKGNKLASAEVTTRLKHMIVSVDGNSDRTFVKNFVMNMYAMDARSLREHMNEYLPTVDMTFDYECPSCSHTERMDVPLTVQFFWPDSRG